MSIPSLFFVRSSNYEIVSPATIERALMITGSTAMAASVKMALKKYLTMVPSLAEL